MSLPAPVQPPKNTNWRLRAGREDKTMGQWEWEQMQAYSAILHSGHGERLRVNLSTTALESGVDLIWMTTG